MILNGKLLQNVDCIKYLGSQASADGGCETDVVQRMNKMKSVLSNRGLGINAKCLNGGTIL